MIAISTLVAGVGTLIAALIVLYLLKPVYRKIPFSAFRFMPEQLQKPTRRPQLVIRRLLTSPLFWLRLAFLVAVLVTLLLVAQTLAGRQLEQMGIHLIVDTSASMSTPATASDTSESRLTRIKADIDVLFDLTDILAADQLRVCYEISAFDDALTPIITTRSSAEARQALQGIEHRPLGTRLTAVRSAIVAADDASNEPDINNADASGASSCRITHVVVLTDQPAPVWLEGLMTERVVVWQTVGEPVDNIGIVTVGRLGGGTLGWDGELVVSVRAYGNTPTNTLLILEANPDTTAADTAALPAPQQTLLQWNEPGVREAIFALPAPGTYTIRLAQGGRYIYDDRVTFTVASIEQIQVDWLLADRFWPDLLNWQQNAATPDLRVGPPGTPLDPNVPTLLVANVYAAHPQPAAIDYFDETHPLLEGVHLDAAEQAAIQGVVLPDPFRPLLTGTDGGAWLGTTDSPRAAYIPGLPLQSADADLNSLSMTIFFNALRWLLDERSNAPLYRLTHANQPQPGTGYAVLHPDEGNTSIQPASAGDLNQITPVQAPDTNENGIWIILLLVASLLLLMERTLTTLTREQ